MIFKITEKVTRQLNISKLQRTINLEEKAFFKEWNINIVYINHIKYFMFTECKTLFTIIKYAKGINSIEKFESFAGDVFAEIFNDLIEGLNLKTMKLNNCIYSKTENNNVRRAQIDHLYHAGLLVEQGKNAFDINRIPIASIGYRFPVDLFIEEISKIVEKDGAIFISDSLLN